MKLSQLPLCVECDKPVIGPETGRGPFYVVRTSLAIVNPKAASGVLGLITIMSGGKTPSNAAINIAEAMAPDAEGAILVVGDEDSKLMTEFALCQGCALIGNHRFPVWMEKANEKKGS